MAESGAAGTAVLGEVRIAQADARVLAPVPPAMPAAAARSAAGPVAGFAGRVPWSAAKRALDVLLAVSLLLVLAPVLVLVAVAIKLDSPGPVFHRVHRMGFRGEAFEMLKFRKMFDGVFTLPLTTANDPRLTRVGRLLTRARIDELPQLWHVLRGEMSLVGPRPEDPRFVAGHADAYDTILSVRPGITGITQLAFADERNILDARNPVGDYVERIMPGKVRLDLLYAQRSHPWLDIAVIYWTLRALLTGVPVAVCRATGQMNVRRRPAT